MKLGNRRLSATSLALASSLALGGCVTQVAYTSTNPNITQQQFLQDRYECTQEAMGFVANPYGAAAVPSAQLYVNCMALRGYRQDNANGTLIVPAELVTQMYN